MTKVQALAILELHKTVPQPTFLLLQAIKLVGEIKQP